MLLCRHLGYERVFLSLYKMTDPSFHIQGDFCFDLIQNQPAFQFIDGYHCVDTGAQFYP